MQQGTSVNGQDRRPSGHRDDAPRAAVIGTGFIAGLHMDALGRIGVGIGGVLARDAAAARGRYPAVYDSMDQVCADPAVSVVHVTTPNDLHFAQVKELVLAGKHVVCEKPLALASADGADMLGFAAQAGVLHAVCFNVRFYPVIHHLRDLVTAGELGPVHLVTGSYQQDWLLYADDWNWRVDQARGGTLRAVSDIGSHWLDLAEFVTGARVDRVHADLSTVHRTRSRPGGPVATFGGMPDGPREQVPVSTDDLACLLLRFDNGARGTAAVSQVSAGRKNSCRIEVYGGRGSAAWSSERPEELWLGHRDAPNELLLRDPGLLSSSAQRVARLPGGHAEGFADTFAGLFERVYTAVRTGAAADQQDYPTFADGLRSLLLQDAISASAASGGWITPAERRIP